MISFSQIWVLCTVVSNTSSPVMVFSSFVPTLELSDSSSGLPHRIMGSPPGESARRELRDERWERGQVGVYDLAEGGFNVRPTGPRRQNDLCGRRPRAVDRLTDLNV